MTAHSQRRGSTLAGAASVAFNPSIWGGGFVVYLAIHLATVPGVRWAAAGLGFLSVSAVPVGLLFVLRATGRLEGVEMRDRSQRELVYVACSASYALGAVAVYLIGAPWPVWGLVAVHAPSALVLAACNRLTKVSIHTAGLAGLVAAGLVLFGAAALPLAVLPLIGGWARWAAQAHTFKDLVAGGVIGFVLTGGGMAALRLVHGGLA